MSDNMLEYQEAFYGNDDGVDEEALTKLCRKMAEDIMAAHKIKFTQGAKEAILKGLEHLRRLNCGIEGYSKPVIARDVSIIMSSEIHAFRAKKPELEAGIVSDEQYKELARMEDVTVSIFALYETFFEKHLKTVTDTLDAKILAYKDLLQEYLHPVGKAYLVVGWKLPWQFQIYNEPAVIEMMNAHPSFKTLERNGTGTAMMVNGKPWGNISFLE